MISNNRIRPIFLSDGKPPIEKMQLLQERQEKKRAAEVIYNTILQERSYQP